MANRFIDSCDHYAAGDILSKYSAVGSTAPTIGTGRTANGLSMNGSSAASYAMAVLDNQTVWYIGCAIKPSAVGSIVSALTGGNFQIGVMLNSDGTLQFHDSSLTAIGTASTSTIALNNWCYLEVKFTIASSISSGDCVVKVNGTTVLTAPAGMRSNYSNGTTANDIAFGQWNWFRFAANYSGIFDDIYINDSTGSSPNNGFLGDVTVDALFTNTAGTYQDFTVTGTTTSVLATTDRAEDGDTTYVSSNTTNDRESFFYTSPSFSINAVYAVQLLSFAKKVGSGNRNLTPFTRSGITNYEQTGAAIGTSYGYTRTIVSTNPATGVAWTESDILGIEAGVKAT